ncbi:MAG TPA: alkaline phosphatase family protein [Lapillicoccus sp.]|nr:alkaline phosphatase family protein [Lapillicoccus sp.]
MADHAPGLPDSGWASAGRGAEDRIARRSFWAESRRALWSLVVAAVGVGLGLLVVGGVSLRRGLLVALVLVVALFLLDALLNPLLRRLAARGSVVLALLLGILSQVVVVVVVIAGLGIQADSWVGVLVVLVVAAVVISLGQWLATTTDTAYIIGSAVTRRRPTGDGVGAADRPRGLLVVQLDGVSREVVERALVSGQAPNLDRWLGDTHRLLTWWSTVPSTTPASMAGFLHGDAEQVAAFRWWDRGEGRLLATSKPADSELIERRFAPGQGLLRDGGAAVSTTYTGGAAESYLTMSQAVSTRRLGSGSDYVTFFARPFLLLSTLLLTFGEMVKELYQGRRQRVRGVQPRIGRTGAYVLLRGVTNVLLRRLNLSVVAEQMGRGRPVVYVDFVDYDEIAHHAGPERPEAMDAVEGLDTVLGHLQHVAGSVETAYELVVVSDHGQSLGTTFEQLTGQSLAERIADLMHAGDVDRVESTAGEEWGPVNALVSSVLSPRRRDPVVLGPDRGHTARSSGSDLPELAVTGGGNLGMVWFPRLPARPDVDGVSDAWPNLLPGLLSTPGVGLVMVLGGAGSMLVFGPQGVRDLDGGVLEGADPLAAYPSRTAADLARLGRLPHCGDLVLISTVDEFGRIHAFEDQVGSHGGIGGPQNHAILIHPRAWSLDDDLLEEVDGVRMPVGPVAVHRQLLRWRRRIGAGPADAADV